MDIKSSLGDVKIANEVIQTIAGLAAVEVFGIVGMHSKASIKDGLADLMNKDNFKKGIVVRNDEEGNVHVDAYVIVKYGVKISEVALNAQEGIQYQLKEMLGLSVDTVNIYVQDVKVTSEEKEQKEEKDKKST